MVETNSAWDKPWHTSRAGSSLCLLNALVLRDSGITWEVVLNEVMWQALCCPGYHGLIEVLRDKESLSTSSSSLIPFYGWWWKSVYISNGQTHLGKISFCSFGQFEQDKDFDAFPLQRCCFVRLITPFFLFLCCLFFLILFPHFWYKGVFLAN